ncbi:hypothetical protein EGW08_010240 [Elysia chlorotica]|uniref:SOCS box domain-containing protein n=1 Tax=Elysia chlorotica TaxID=188477 RepID=A0A3S1C3K0_ELYCH|nr:hypothetical protein EGW08_010240 [Elysia chlorotica]
MRAVCILRTGKFTWQPENLLRKMARQSWEAKLRVHVEAHNLDGLRRAIEGIDISTSMDPCRLKPGKKRSMRQFLKENESVVERACLLGHLDMLEIFLLNGCSSNLPTSHGRLIHTVLAALKVHRWLVDSGAALASIRLLLDMDCDVNVKSYQGKSPLLLAAEIADPPIIAELLNHCLPWQLTCSDPTNRHTPLHMACMSGSVRCVRLLLEQLKRGEGVDAGDSVNLSPLLSSLMVIKNQVAFHRGRFGVSLDMLLRAQYSHMAIVELLVEQGARPTKPISPHLVPRFMATSVGFANSLHSLPTFRSALQTALEAAHQYEIHLIISRDKGESSTETKRCTFYSELVHMLAHNCGAVPFTRNEIEVWSHAHPFIQELLRYVNVYLKSRISQRRNPARLLTLSRHVIRIQAAKADCLSKLEQLPLPRKLKDYVRFISL